MKESALNIDITTEEGFKFHWDNETDEYWKFMQRLADKASFKDAVPAKSVADLLKT
jgi:hypothetical protein